MTDKTPEEIAAETILCNHLVGQLTSSCCGACADNRESVAAAIRAERERTEQRIKNMSVVELMVVNPNVDSFVREWESRCLKAEAALRAGKDEELKNDGYRSRFRMWNRIDKARRQP